VLSLVENLSPFQLAARSRGHLQFLDVTKNGVSEKDNKLTKHPQEFSEIYLIVRSAPGLMQEVRILTERTY